MTTNSSLLSTRVANYKLSSSYPSISPLCSRELNHNNSFSLNCYTKSWSNYQNCNYNMGFSKSIVSESNGKQLESTYNCDLQPLTWLQKDSIINIDPLLDIDDEMMKEESSIAMSNTPGYEDLVNPQLNHAKVEVESQENSNIHDFVRFQAMRASMNQGSRVALRSNNWAPSGTLGMQDSQNLSQSTYSHQASGFVKPNLSYTQLIFMAIETCQDRAMTVNDIYQWCEVNYPYYKHIGPSWKNSLRHNLSINKSFRRMPRDGQTTLGSYEMNSSDDMGDEGLSHRDTKQGGPGRGAYWVVDDKERKNLLDSIYRAHQTMPLGDRNGQRIDPPYSLIVNPPKNGPLLRIDGRFTDASTYLQSKRTEDETVNENPNKLLDSVSTENQPASVPTENCDAEYASMMYNLAANGSDDVGDASVKLSASLNSNFSRQEDPDSDPSKPRLKNRRKSKHEKVRPFEMESSSVREPLDSGGVKVTAGTKSDQTRTKQTNHGMTSVNVIVAPHFDHIYARYQQFLPPAISSDMDKAVFSAHGDSGTDAEFLRRGLLEDDYQDECDDEDDDTVKKSLKGETIDESVVKLEKMETEQPPSPSLLTPSKFRNSLKNGLENHPRVSKRIKLWTGTKLNSASVAFTRQRKVQQAITRRVRKSLRIRRGRGTAVFGVEVKREPLEPIEQSKELSDGYGTDSTMPMIARQKLRRKGRNVKTVTVGSTRKRPATRLSPIKRDSNGNKTGQTLEKRHRSKRKRSRPLRIDESKEIAAIQFLASLEKRHQKLKNIENLYNFSAYLKSSLSTGDSSCNSSVVLVHD